MPIPTVLAAVAKICERGPPGSSASESRRSRRAGNQGSRASSGSTASSAPWALACSKRSDNRCSLSAPKKTSLIKASFIYGSWCYSSRAGCIPGPKPFDDLRGRGTDGAAREGRLWIVLDRQLDLARDFIAAYARRQGKRHVDPRRHSGSGHVLSVEDNPLRALIHSKLLELG